MHAQDAREDSVPKEGVEEIYINSEEWRGEQGRCVIARAAKLPPIFEPESLNTVAITVMAWTNRTTRHWWVYSPMCILARSGGGDGPGASDCLQSPAQQAVGEARPASDEEVPRQARAQAQAHRDDARGRRRPALGGAWAALCAGVRSVLGVCLVERACGGVRLMRPSVPPTSVCVLS